MKTCPVCGDVTFDDQPICFGCMHRYDAQDTLSPSKGDASAGGLSWSIEERDVQRLEGRDKAGADAEALPSSASASSASALPTDWPRVLLEPFSFRVMLAPIASEGSEITWSCTVCPDCSNAVSG